jgi:hypothetical protein
VESSLLSSLLWYPRINGSNPFSDWEQARKKNRIRCVTGQYCKHCGYAGILDTLESFKTLQDLRDQNLCLTFQTKDTDETLKTCDATLNDTELQANFEEIKNFPYYDVTKLSLFENILTTDNTVSATINSDFLQSKYLWVCNEVYGKTHLKKCQYYDETMQDFGAKSSGVVLTQFVTNGHEVWAGSKNAFQFNNLVDVYAGSAEDLTSANPDLFNAYALHASGGKIPCPSAGYIFDRSGFSADDKLCYEVNVKTDHFVSVVSFTPPKSMLENDADNTACKKMNRPS